MKKNKAVFNWSGGKDSSLALYRVLKSNQYEIVGLLTTINEKFGRISMHGVRENLLELQAESLNLPLIKVYLPEKLEMNEYTSIISKKMKQLHELGVTHSIYGDIFLEDLKMYREKQLDKMGFKAVFPLWNENTNDLAEEFIRLGFKTVVTAVDGSKLGEDFVLNEFSQSFLKSLPDTVDPCGENGEFHSFVYNGPIFKNEITFTKGEVVTEYYKHDGKEFKFYFGDLVSNKK